jgi:methylphosphotriester-DNA--protein-cysteine methyltransferase
MEKHLNKLPDCADMKILDSGFKSLRTFNRAFKEKFKTSPSEAYRPDARFG